ncbi:hypothetical protein LIER_16440 [Lithospermum erythrorhizon]|uniref:Secreted protein n=1 Tax=Lithospermum erythrorhizon TaxID=34254 RepID=A0AAV3Q8K0_LITER
MNCVIFTLFLLECVSLRVLGGGSSRFTPLPHGFGVKLVVAEPFAHVEVLVTLKFLEEVVAGVLCARRGSLRPSSSSPKAWVLLLVVYLCILVAISCGGRICCKFMVVSCCGRSCFKSCGCFLWWPELLQFEVLERIYHPHGGPRWTSVVVVVGGVLEYKADSTVLAAECQASGSGIRLL